MYSPQAEQSTVAYPAVQDWRENAKRKANENPKYPAPTEDGHMLIWRAEVCLMYRTSRATKGAYTGRPFLPVFGTLQNFGDANKSVYENTRMVHFGGISGTPTLVDTQGKAPYMELPTLFGGTITILNTGDDIIFNGDRLMWRLPPSAKAALTRFAQMPGRPAQRIPIPIEPYRPENQKMNAELIRAFGTGKEKTHKDDAIAHGAVSFLRGACELMFLGALLNEAGAFGDGRGNLDTLPASQEAMTLRVRQVILDRGMKVLRMAQALGIRDLATPEDALAWSGVHFKIRSFCVRYIIPKKENEYIVPLVNGDMHPTGFAGQIFDAQTGVAEKILKSVVATNDYYTDRIFAKAITTAPPNKAVDIVIGHYAA